MQGVNIVASVIIPAAMTEGVAGSIRTIVTVYGRKRTRVRQHGLDKSVEESLEKLGAVLHHDCYVDMKPEGMLSRNH